jgi:hypothetical protein
LALAQLRKIDLIIAALRKKKSQFKDQIGHISGMHFRKLNDPEGECATLLTVLFDDPRRAASVARALGTKTVDQSGWHVYANMEHVSQYLKAHDQPSGRGAYPRTDDVLSRAINVSVGVVDAGLGSAFGININSTDAEIAVRAQQFRAACGSPAKNGSRRMAEEVRPRLSGKCAPSGRFRPARSKKKSSTSLQSK